MSAPLFRLHISHAWYADGRLSGWALQACAETAATMRRHGLHWHATAGEFALLAPGDDAAAYLEALKLASNDAPLRFRIMGDVAHFAHITDLPSRLDRMPDFSSRQSSLAQHCGKPARQLLAQSDQADPHGELLLYPSDLARALPETQWHIHFGARALPWTYYIVNRGQSAFTRPVVRGEDGLCLSGPVPTSLPDGEPALRFDSGDLAFPLRQAAATQFGLYDQVHSPLSEQSAEVCLVRRLPTPIAGALAWTGSGNQRRIHATVFVYL